MPEPLQLVNRGPRRLGAPDLIEVNGKMIRRILLPLDTTRDSRQAIRYGDGVAAALEADLRLLHVASGDGAADRRGRTGARSEEAGPLPARAPAQAGLVAETIVEYADYVDADLILMPTRGRGLLGQILFGSTTMDVLRIADRPVWAVKPEAIRSERPVRCKRILCGVELGATGESVLNYAAQWAAAWGGELLIAHAVPEISEAMLTLYGLDESGEIELLPEKARRSIAAMATTLGVRCEVEAQVGDAAGILRTLAKQWSADVVIVGRGRGTDARRLGANVGDIIAQAPCPVIAYAERSRGGRPPGRRALSRVAAARRPGSLAAA